MLVSPARANFEQVALRPRHSPFPMLPVEEAMETVLRHAPSMSIIELSSLQGVPTDYPTHSYLWSSLVPRLSPVAWEWGYFQSNFLVPDIIDVTRIQNPA